MNFEHIQIGERAEIVGYNPSEKRYRRRLLSMGLTRGAVFTLIKVAPLGDPVEIEIRGYRLSLRKREARVLKVERVEGIRKVGDFSNSNSNVGGVF